MALDPVRTAWHACGMVLLLLRPVLLLLLLPGPVLAQTQAAREPNPVSRAATPAPRARAAADTSAAVRPSATNPATTKPATTKPAVVRARSGTSVQRRVPVAVPVAPPAPAAVAEPDKPAEPTKGSNTGNPLPRFATLRSDEVNLRTGPGTRYPIDWVYKRRDLPVLIEREFEVWRLVRDPEGVKGWVHQATLAPRRTGVVLAGAAPEQVLRSDPRESAAAVARLRPGVIVRLRSCEATSDWCQAQVQDYHGWIRRSDIWGTLPGEAIQ